MISWNLFTNNKYPYFFVFHLRDSDLTDDKLLSSQTFRLFFSSPSCNHMNKTTSHCLSVRSLYLGHCQQVTKTVSYLSHLWWTRCYLIYSLSIFGYHFPVKTHPKTSRLFSHICTLHTILYSRVGWPLCVY